MTEEDVVHIVRFYIEGLFPKVCLKCGRRFESLRDYLEAVTHVGLPAFYEPTAAETQMNLLGPMSHANCTCGTTLSIGSEGIPRAQMIELMQWARNEALRRSITMPQLLGHIRERIDAAVFRDEEGRGSP